MLPLTAFTQPTPLIKQIDVGETYAAPLGTTGSFQIDGIEHEYLATPERRTQIINGYKKLQLGQDRETVRAALGSPDTARPMYGKQFHGPFLGWSYMYKIKMRASSPNTNDVCVEVFFDPDDKLKWAVPNHIKGLSAIGKPGNT